MSEADEQVAKIKALLVNLVPKYDASNGNSFEGFENGPEHRTVGTHRAWCYEASEWCSPDAACSACDPIDAFDIRQVLGLL